MVAGEVRSILILNIADMDEYSELADSLFNEDDNVSEFTSLMVMSPFKRATAEGILHFLKTGQEQSRLLGKP